MGTAQTKTISTQSERRLYLLRALLRESQELSGLSIPLPEDERSQRDLLRTLFNRRPPRPVSVDFLAVQDAYLQEELREMGITDIDDLMPEAPYTYLWRGDITTLRCDAIVNAANRELLGCFIPYHKCIDNAIHTYAGVQLRLECARIMRQQGHPEPSGRAKITRAYNLPCRHIIHTVGPIVRGGVTPADDRVLGESYRSCLETAAANGATSIAFCCLSTGEFQFPRGRAAKIAVVTVNRYRQETGSRMKVLYNVFTEEDEEVYRDLL